MLYSVSDKTAESNPIDYTEFVQQFTISNDLAQKIENALPSFGIAFDGDYGPVVPVIMSNTLIIYFMYLATEVMIFLPKMAIKLMHMPFGKGD